VSVLVLQVFVRGGLMWLGLALLVHTVVDGVSVAVPELFGGDRASGVIVAEALITVFAGVALWLIWSLRCNPV
jgi:hypothetical protein